MESKWIIKKKKKVPKIEKGILIVGLPGIGNVGKITADFLVDELNAEEIYKINSTYFPHSVFISEEGLLDLPCVSLHVVKKGKRNSRDLVFLTGDVQPMDEQASYKFCDKIIEIGKEMGCTETITVGGIGLPGEPKKPRVYGVATDKKTKNFWKKKGGVRFKKNKANTIVGATGLIPGLGINNGIKGISLLCETAGHPYHLGLREASKILKILKKVLNLKIDLNRLKKEIEKEEIEKTEKMKETYENALIKKLKRFSKDRGDVSYIG